MRPHPASRWKLLQRGAEISVQGADQYRVSAYARAAATVRHWPTPVAQLYRVRGLAGLEELPGVGIAIARAIRELVTRGRLPMLDRLRGDADPIVALTSVPGIGRRTADRLYHELGLATLEDLENAAHDGRLATIAGFGGKRLAGIRDSLGQRLGRLRPRSRTEPDVPSVAELLDVDREYREKAAAGELRRIAPRRFNPEGTAWLPVLHTTRGRRRYTALFSNTARAHREGKTDDWVVLYVDGELGEQQYTVITATHGRTVGRRIVAGRASEHSARTHRRVTVRRQRRPRLADLRSAQARLSRLRLRDERAQRRSDLVERQNPVDVAGFDRRERH